MEDRQGLRGDAYTVADEIAAEAAVLNVDTSVAEAKWLFIGVLATCLIVLSLGILSSL